MFKYKINKSINLGIVEDYQVDDPLETIKIFNIEITQNQNIYENMTLLKQVFDILNINFEIIFKFEKHQEKITRFETAFYYMERKKLPK
ncbi:MAG: hypothetical protein LBC61_04945 [Candidatus Peribacteria bacterium]|jgi:hypothetical protein|nr:hypothetical protein [Candidatus Peribacteria bacterium]